jgi:hypothetical protein
VKKNAHFMSRIDAMSRFSRRDAQICTAASRDPPVDQKKTGPKAGKNPG